MAAEWPAILEALSTVGLVVFAGVQLREGDQDRRERQGAERRAREAGHRILWARATYLRRQLNRLPATTADDQWLSRPEWRAEDEQGLERAAEAIDGPTIIEAADAARMLDMLRRHYNKMTEGPPQVRSSTLPPADRLSPDDWKRVRSEVDELLARLEATGAGTRIKPKVAVSA